MEEIRCRLKVAHLPCVSLFQLQINSCYFYFNKISRIEDMKLLINSSFEYEECIFLDIPSLFLCTSIKRI